MGKCCCKLVCSASGEEYEIKDAAARSSIIDLQNADKAISDRVAKLEVGTGSGGGSACTYGVGYLVKTSNNDASTPVRVNASDLMAEKILPGSKVTLHFTFSEASSLPGFYANFGTYDISLPGTHNYLFSPAPSVNYYSYTLECFFVNGLFRIYHDETVYEAAFIEMGIGGENGENQARVTFFKEMS